MGGQLDKALIEFLQTKVPDECIFADEPMDKHTTFRVGGCADCYVEIGKVEELSAIIKYLKQTEREKLYFSSLSHLFLFQGALNCFLLQLFSNKTRNCLFFVRLRGFLTLATLFGSYIFLLFVSVMEQCNAHFYR